MAWKGSTGAATCNRREDICSPSSSSRTISKSARPSTSVSSSASESNRSMSDLKLLQSSWRTHLQYISTNGRSCVQVARIAWRDGAIRPACRRHTSCPELHGRVGGVMNRGAHNTENNWAGTTRKPTLQAEGTGEGLTCTQFCFAEQGLMLCRIRIIREAKHFVAFPKILSAADTRRQLRRYKQGENINDDGQSRKSKTTCRKTETQPKPRRPPKTRSNMAGNPKPTKGIRSTAQRLAPSVQYVTRTAAPLARCRCRYLPPS